MKKYSYLYEIPLFYAFLHFFNQIFAVELPGFIGMSPHPYWAGILLFGFRYGTLAGFSAGVISAALFLASNWVFGEKYLFEDFSFYAQPSLFVIVGTLVGAGVQRYRTVIQNLLKDKSILNAREKSLKEELGTHQDIIKELEKRIVTRMSTLITLYEGARKLESVRLEELYKAILGFIAKTLDVEQAALYVKDQDQFVLKESYGWKADHSWPLSFVEGQGVNGLAAARKKITTVRDFLSQDEGKVMAQLSVQDALIAGPLRQGEQGEIVGIFAVQSLAFLSFNSATINLFAFLLNWANRSIGRATYIQSLKSHEIVDPDYGIYSYRYLQTRSDEEFSRSKTYYLPLSVGLAQVEGLDVLTPEKRLAVMLAISQLLKESCRSMDVVASYPDPKTPFAILMLTASNAQALEIKKKILEQFSRLDFSSKVSLRIGISSFSPKTENFQTLIETARRDVENA